MLARRDWLPAAVRAVGVKRKLKAGQTLFRRASRTVGLYEVLSGNVRLVRSDRATTMASGYSRKNGLHMGLSAFNSSWLLANSSLAVRS
jgi:hypothetical protein